MVFTRSQGDAAEIEKRRRDQSLDRDHLLQSVEEYPKWAATVSDSNGKRLHFEVRGEYQRKNTHKFPGEIKTLALILG